VRVLGVDFGTKRLGLALSDPDGTLALPAGTLTRRALGEDLAALRRLVEEKGVERAVVGLPLHMDGRRGPEAEAAEVFAAALAEATGIPVDLLDERWTTVEAERALREGGVRGRRRRQAVDSMAASLLLRSYLERRRSGLPSTPPAEGQRRT
jgi:putative Holliday junction resolvase